MERAEIRAQSLTRLDNAVTDADLLAALDRARQVTQLRPRQPGEFDVYQFAASLGDSPPSQVTMERELQRMMEEDGLKSRMAYDARRRRSVRVYWWPK